MASVFTKIISGEFPSYKIYEDDKTIAFLALDQVNLGHTLIVPKKETDYWIDMPEKEYADLQMIALKVGRAIQKATDCRKVFQAMVGLEVPHVHLHLIPGWAIADLSFSKAQRHPDEKMREIQKRIVQALG